MIPFFYLYRWLNCWVGCVLMVMVCATTSKAQLDQGDLVLLGINANDDFGADCNGAIGAEDVLILLTLKDLAPSTAFMITDNGYNRDATCGGYWGNTEGVLKLTTPSATTIPAGTIIRFGVKAAGSNKFNQKNNLSYPLSCTIVGTFNITANEGAEDQVSIIDGSSWNNGTVGSNDASAGGNVIFSINNDDLWSGCTDGTDEYDSDADGDLCYKVTHFEASIGQGRYFIYNGPTTATNYFTWVIRTFTPICNWQGYDNCTDWNNAPVASLNSITISPFVDGLSCVSNCESCAAVAPTVQVTVPTVPSCGLNTVKFKVTLSNGQTISNITTPTVNVTLTNPIATNTLLSITKLEATYAVIGFSTFICELFDYPGEEQLTISGVSSPTVDAGPDQPYCALNTVNLTGSYTGTVTGLTWSIISGGTGSFGNSSQANTTFTPNASGVYTLRLASNDPDGAGPCVAATNDVVLSFNLGAPPIVSSERRCGAGTVTFNATGCVGGTVNWFDVDAGGTPIATGATFTTPALTSTNIYYVECEVGACVSARIPVMAIIHADPVDAILTVSDDNICPSESVTFTATIPPATPGTYKYEFFKNGISLGPASYINTIVLNNLLNADQITVKTYKTITYNGIIPSNSTSGDTRFWPGIPSLFVSSKNPTEGTGAFGVDHRINGINITGVGDSIYLMVAGRVADDNRIVLFIDSKAGGYNTANYGRTGAVGLAYTLNAGTTFDAGFFADYALTIGTTDLEPDYYLDLLTLSGTCGNATCGGPSTYLGSNNTLTTPFGVTEANPVATMPADYTRGFELALKKSDIGYSGGDLKLFAVYGSDAGFLSNQFITPANTGEGAYGNGPVAFNLATPNPIIIPQKLLEDDCVGESLPVVMTVSAVPTVSFLPSNPTFCIGSITGMRMTAVSVSGNTFEWNTGATSASISIVSALPSTYTVTVTNAQGCTVSQTQTFTTTNTPNLVLTTVPASFGQNNGAVSVVASGSNSPYTYDWSNDGPDTPDNDLPNLMNLAPGTYTITVSDIYCTTTATVVLSQSAAAPPTVVCNPTTVVLNSTGGVNISAGQLLQTYIDDNSTTPASSNVTPNNFNCSSIGAGASAGSGLFISEYIEGNVGSEKYIELYNATGSVIDLSKYSLRLFPNGALVPSNNVTLSGTLANGATVVYKNASATNYGAGINNAAVNFDGNDAIALWNNVSGFPVDIVGSIGQDPGVKWVANGLESQNVTLRRKPTVSTGISTNPTTNFLTLGTQWGAAGTAFSTTDLGSHTINAPSASGNLVTLTVTDIDGQTGTCNAVVYVVDATPPLVVCTDLTVSLSTAGTATVNVFSIVSATSDACGLPTVTASETLFNCADLSNTLATDLFFSEYVENPTGAPSTANSKFLEIYNGTGLPVNLSNYKIDLYSNGALVPTATIPLPNTILADGSAFVFKHPNNSYIANVPVACAVDGGTDSPSGTFMSYNGDDAIVLLKGTDTLDIIGKIGEDPGTAWTAGLLSTSDFSLRRKPNVFEGITTNPASGFPTLATEWTGVANTNATALQANISSLCAHTYTGSLSTQSVLVTSTDVNGNEAVCVSNITVVDNLAPTITCPATANTTTNTGCTATSVALGTATATDNCPTPAPVITPVGVFPTAFQLGSTLLTYQAEDNFGNTATCTQLVVVTDNDAPTIICGNIIASLFEGVYDPDPLDNATIIDNCSGNLDVAINLGQLNCTNLGSNVAIITVIDLAGNSATCQYTITLIGAANNTVINNTSSVISCSQPSITLTGAGGSSFVWSTGATTNAISVITAGIYTVTATFSNGCTDSASKTITGNATPPDPPVATSDSLCEGQNTSAILATGCPGGIINWYASATGGSSVFAGPNYNPNATDDITRYVSCKIATCESTRLAVTWDFFPTIVPSITADLGECVDIDDVVLYSALPAQTGTLFLYEFFVNGNSQGAPSTSDTFSYDPDDGDQIYVTVSYNF